MCSMKNIGIILAGGSGHRMGGDLPKQFLRVANKTILEHTISVFEQSEEIDEIYVVSNPDFLYKTQDILKDKYPKVSHIIAGGKKRSDSTLAALAACGADDCNLVIHDAVRPLVSVHMISECILSLQTYAACTTAIPSTDTILVSDISRACIQDIPNRDFLYNVQTPQAFRKSVLTKAYKMALCDPQFGVTDDCGVVQKYLAEIPIRIIAGSTSNIKVTYPEDLVVIEKYLKD